MVLLRDIEALDNGARFHNADLHIHSYGASHDVRDATMTPEAIIDSAVRQGLSLIAITDHNTGANVQRAIDHANNSYAGKILVLPGVEITTAHGHLLAYFAPARTADLMRLLTRLDLIGEMGADNTRTAKSMSDAIAEVDRLGGVCIAAHIDREKTGFENFAPGLQNWKKDIITSPGLYGLEADSNDALLWYSDQDSGALGVERKKVLSAREEVAGLSGRHHLAHVQGSDAHTMMQFEHQRPVKSWTRIKLTDLTFNAFRVALIDPSARVRASASVPSSVPRIRGIAITGGFLHGAQIQFSNNLNCFIGGRGTGKSTAIRAIAYAFGLNEEFGDFGNCPDSVTVFSEDENGIKYRYNRTRSGDIEVKAMEDSSISDVPIDSFKFEYFGQGDLAKIAEDPLKNPQLLQDFLDRHTNLRDLAETEQLLTSQLNENAGRLGPLKASFSQMEAKKATLAEIEKKLQIADEGNLKEVVGTQSKLASEKAVREAVEIIVNTYKIGYNFSNMYKNFDQIAKTSGICTSDPASIKAMQDIKQEFEKTNASIKEKEIEVNKIVKDASARLLKSVSDLQLSHQRMSGEIAARVAALKASGAAADLPGLQEMLRQKTAVATEIAGVQQRADELRECEQQRADCRSKLEAVRRQMTTRRKAQLKDINSNLGRVIKDYTIFLRYDDSGITEQFEEFLRVKMSGTYLQDTAIKAICSNITPAELADWMLSRSYDRMQLEGGISQEWAEKLIGKLCYWNTLFELHALAKPPKPVISVQTKALPKKEIPVHQLSDGQRHTILLTIAMLAESNIPLVIDQPEDDLDNAFIFSSIVKTLREIKEKRQVILVTHNANIAVLGDSELLLPMFRQDDVGTITGRGSIDSETTKSCVLDILEGGTEAFQRRKVMYDH